LFAVVNLQHAYSFPAEDMFKVDAARLANAVRILQREIP
jgi:hypothetical protein